MEEQKKATVDLGMNLYDFNKQAMNQFQPLDAIALNIKLNEMADNLIKRFDDIPTFQSSKYWMLLNHENRDYTTFSFAIDFDKGKFISDMRECLMNRGSVLDIELNDDGAWEIWIKDTVDGENLVYYFFNYTSGVIEIH